MNILVVGSGAAGVHFALTALERGHGVEMIDVGFAPEPAPAADAAFPDLPAKLDDPVGYFLGADGGQVVYPGPAAKFYGFPPSKQYVFRRPAQFVDRSERFDPLISFARGGLAEAWTGGSYEYSSADLSQFPVSLEALGRGYRTVSRRIGVSGARDDLERFSPFSAEYLEPLPLDPHSDRLTQVYRRRHRAINQGGFYLGRSRVALLTTTLGDRGHCTRLGRCLWGCPRQALYAPSATLRVCQTHPGFRYRPGWVARRLVSDADGTVRALQVQTVDGTADQHLTADLYVLAAGTIGSSKIYLDSVAARSGDPVRLGGLLDNRMAMVPFLTLAMIGHRAELADYQFHLLAFGIEAARAEEHAHGQITTLKAASIHPIVQNLPLDLRTALAVFRRIRAGLAVATLWVHDRPNEANHLAIAPDGDGQTALHIVHQESEWQRAQLSWAIERLRRGLRRLGAVVPRGMTKVLAHGASVHYGGTIPMAVSGGPHTLTPEGRSRLFRNLLVADASGFPFLPAKNHTFTLMANAVRIAEALP